MSKPKNVVDLASDDSFPASDPPSFTPVTGSGDPHAPNKVFKDGSQQVVLVKNGRGEELRAHLASHGFKSKVDPDAETSFERVSISGASEMQDVQAILDEWED